MHQKETPERYSLPSQNLTREREREREKMVSVVCAMRDLLERLDTRLGPRTRERVPLETRERERERERRFFFATRVVRDAFWMPWTLSLASALFERDAAFACSGRLGLRRPRPRTATPKPAAASPRSRDPPTAARACASPPAPPASPRAYTHSSVMCDSFVFEKAHLEPQFLRVSDTV